MTIPPPLESAAWLLGFAAIGGVLFAIMRFSGKPHPPAWLALGHGLLAASGLGLLVYVAATAGVPTLAKVAIALFAAAAGGGVYMNAAFHRKGKALPIPFVLGHGTLALAGLAALLLSLRPA